MALRSIDSASRALVASSCLSSWSEVRRDRMAGRDTFCFLAGLLFCSFIAVTDLDDGTMLGMHQSSSRPGEQQ